MNEVWQQRLKQSQERIRDKTLRRRKLVVLWSYAKKLLIILIIVQIFFPEYLKRMIYPYIYGKATTEKVQISSEDSFEDINEPRFRFDKDGWSYVLYPRTKYSVTGRIGIVERYDTLFGKIFRGQFQGDYINLVPLDLFIVINELAKPEIFKMFRFVHEERMGGIRCKGVKYRESVMSGFFSSWSEYEKSKANLAKCQPYMKDEYLNNYHPIPANKNVDKALHQIVAGDVVHLEGVLVDVPQMGLKTGTRKNQYHKELYGGRGGAGMCFILYTTKVILNNRIYE